MKFHTVSAQLKRRTTTTSSSLSALFRPRSVLFSGRHLALLTVGVLLVSLRVCGHPASGHRSTLVKSEAQAVNERIVQAVHAKRLELRNSKSELGHHPRGLGQHQDGYSANDVEADPERQVPSAVQSNNNLGPTFPPPLIPNRSRRPLPSQNQTDGLLHSQTIDSGNTKAADQTTPEQYSVVNSHPSKGNGEKLVKLLDVKLTVQTEKRIDVDPSAHEVKPGAGSLPALSPAEVEEENDLRGGYSLFKRQKKPKTAQSSSERRSQEVDDSFEARTRRSVASQNSHVSVHSSHETSGVHDTRVLPRDAFDDSSELYQGSAPDNSSGNVRTYEGGSGNGQAREGGSGNGLTYEGGSGLGRAHEGGSENGRAHERGSEDASRQEEPDHDHVDPELSLGFLEASMNTREVEPRYTIEEMQSVDDISHGEFNREEHPSPSIYQASTNREEYEAGNQEEMNFENARAPGTKRGEYESTNPEEEMQSDNPGNLPRTSTNNDERELRNLEDEMQSDDPGNIPRTSTTNDERELSNREDEMGSGDPGNFPRDEHPEDETRPGEAEIADYDCDDVDPKMAYLTELYERMSARNLPHIPGSSAATTEKITAIMHPESGRHRRLSFNISGLIAEGNITLAQVVVVTDPDKTPNACRASVKGFLSGEPYTCHESPFRVYDMATYDVTSDLKARLNESHSNFQVFVQRRRFVQEAMLVAFTGVDFAELTVGLNPLRCALEARKKRETSEDPSATRNASSAAHTRPKMPSVASIRKVLDRLQIPSLLQRKGHSDLPMKSARRLLSSLVKKKAEGKVQKGIGQGTVQVKGNVRYERGIASAADSMSKRIHSRQRRDVNKEGQSRTSDQQKPSLSLTDLNQRLNDRRKRSFTCTDSTSRDLSHFPDNQHTCHVESFRVSFLEDLQMDNIMFPYSGMDIGKCSGHCDGVLNPRDKVPSRSHMLSLMYLRYNSTDLPPRPSCRPVKFRDECIMRFSHDYNIVIEKWHDARVTECNCL